MLSSRLRAPAPATTHLPTTPPTPHTYTPLPHTTPSTPCQPLHPQYPTCHTSPATPSAWLDLPQPYLCMYTNRTNQGNTSNNEEGPHNGHVKHLPLHAGSSGARVADAIRDALIIAWTSALCRSEVAPEPRRGGYVSTLCPRRRNTVQLGTRTA